MRQLADDMRRYTQVEKSAELAEYNELAHVVTAPEFQEKKRTPWPTAATATPRNTATGARWQNSPPRPTYASTTKCSARKS